MDDAYLLVVDDDPAMHQLLGLILKRFDIAIEYASDGLEALDQILAHPPRLVILDLQMPRLNGIELLHKLTAMIETNNIPVIIYTSNARPVYTGVCKWPSQVVAVLDKTTPPVQLRDLVSNQLSH